MSDNSNIWYLLFTPRSKGTTQVSVFTIWKTNTSNFSAAAIIDIKAYIRPSIVLNSNIKLISGDGTKENAYTIN